MSPKSSALWDYFVEKKEDFTFVICKVPDCGKEISRGKTGVPRGGLGNFGMKNHLKSHTEEYAQFRKKEKLKAEAVFEKSKAEQEASEVEETVQIFKLNTHKRRENFFQQTLPDWVDSRNPYDFHDRRSKEKHKGIITMMITDLKPFSMVNDPGFLNFCKMMDPRFTVGSDSYYRGLVDKCYTRGKAKLEAKLKEDNPPFVSIQLDGWSTHKHGYIGLLVNYISGWRRVCLCLACGPFDQSHTGEAVGQWVEHQCDMWNITDKVNFVVTDTASNMVKMMEYLPTHFRWGECLNHVMQLSIKDELLEKPAIKSLCNSCREICTFANKSVLLSKAITDHQKATGKENAKCLNLVQDVVTRWNSTYLMLDRFLVLQESVKSILLDPEWKKKLKVTIRADDWLLMDRVVKILKIFQDATVQFSSSSACISEVVPTVSSLLYALGPGGSGDQGVKDLKRRLHANILHRLGDKEMDEAYSVATLLDPRFYNFLVICLYLLILLY